MPRYVMSSEANANGAHEIHTLSCTKKASAPTIPLGIHADSRYAIMDAKTRHRDRKLVGCSHCSPESATTVQNPAHT